MKPPAAAGLTRKSRDDEAALLTRVPERVPAKLRTGSIVNNAAERLGNLGEAPAFAVDVDAEHHLLNLPADAVQVDEDLLVITSTLACEVVSAVSDAVLFGLEPTKEDGLQVVALTIQQHSRDVKVALALIHIPTEAHCYAREAKGKIEHAALLHGESHLLPLRG